MNDKEFIKLQLKLRDIQSKEEKLQKLYRRETGRRFIEGQPIIKREN